MYDPHDDVDGNKHPVVEEVSKDVELALTQLPRIDHVEQLHHDEDIEHNGVHFDLGGWLTFLICGAWVCTNPLRVGVERIAVLVLDSKELLAVEKKGKEHTNLLDAVHENVSPHCAIDDHGVSAFWVSVFYNTFTRWLGSQRQGSKSVHNEIDPKHLD